MLAIAIWMGLALWLNPPVLAMGGLPPVDAPAPTFELPIDGALYGRDRLALGDLQGKWVVLYFYPKDFTSGCTLEAQRFQRDLPKYRARNAEIVGVSADSVASHAEFCDSEGLKFFLAADPGGQVSQAYGSWLGFLSARHTFLIDPEGVLRARWVGVNPAIHSEEVLARLTELQRA
ncbi:MAG: peroxiredoxin [Oscillatoriales cyanobacterium SM2_1_8]|nr:peroxiredoxin [Oscillatoriales cyanobacterium SM2_1_8]